MARIEARRREPFIVIGLLVTLLFIWKSGYYAPASMSVHDLSIATCPESVAGPSDKHKGVQAVLEQQHYYSPNHRITWKDNLPESKLVAHATGAVDFFTLAPHSIFLCPAERARRCLTRYGSFGGVYAEFGARYLRRCRVGLAGLDSEARINITFMRADYFHVIFFF